MVSFGDVTVNVSAVSLAFIVIFVLDDGSVIILVVNIDVIIGGYVIVLWVGRRGQLWCD